MLVIEFKAVTNKAQKVAIDEAIRTSRFVRNKVLRYWMDNKGVGKKELYRYNTDLRAEFKFVEDLNSHACQASVENVERAIHRFYDNCKKKIPGKKGYPRFKKSSRSVEYKTSGWKLCPDKKSVKFTDKKGIGKLKLKGTWDLWRFDVKLIKRVRIVSRADGYYVQFCVKVDNSETVETTGKIIGLDVGLKDFYTDSNGYREPSPRFYRKGEKRLKFYQRRVSRKKTGSANRKKAINKLGKTHLKISRQRQEHAKRLARCVVRSNDLVAYEDLRVKNLVKNHCLAKSINDAGWYQFRNWLEYFGTKFGKVTVAVNPAYTSQNCSNCGEEVKKSLSTRTHICQCGCSLDRDHNAAINILNRALSTVGHTGTWTIISPNAGGDRASTVLGENQVQQAGSLNRESPSF
ncbi:MULTISPECIES: transposase [unclassified Moorena]|uniref:RNA-guided endonuclease InsQ/TnpB family protein n=1 Tax=unclassified Moorena TaxID=2683338 RepID=UPI0014003E13|nr:MULTISPECIES: transposase [unclassified Moorena]NEO15380.1 transposase [Moorena sp. SIO3E8]NEQ01118.1 transposase [Moorena sp. SIO3F7]